MKLTFSHVHQNCLAKAGRFYVGDEIYCSKWFSLEFGNAWLHFFPFELTRPPVMFVMLPSFVQQIEFFFQEQSSPYYCSG